MAPLARSLVGAGHQVAFAVAQEFRSEVRDAGFETFTAGSDLADLRAMAQAKVADQQVAPDQQAALMFTRLAPLAMRDALVPLVEQWRPDLLLHEEGEFGAPLVAALLRVPNVVVGWPAPMRPPPVLERLDKSLAELWTASGLAPTRLGGIYRNLFLDTCPPALQSPLAAEVAARRQPLRPIPWQTPDMQPWHSTLDRSSGLPVVHATLGMVSIYNDAPHLFRAIIDGLQGEPVQLVLTIGEQSDPAAFERAGGHVQVEAYIPHALLLPHCSAVICHGGIGTTAAALTYGVPLLVSPRGGASQSRNADACVRAGAACYLAAKDLTADAVRSQVRKLLETADYRQNAERIAREIQTMPSPDRVVNLLEQVALGG